MWGHEILLKRVPQTNGKIVRMSFKNAFWHLLYCRSISAVLEYYCECFKRGWNEFEGWSHCTQIQVRFRNKYTDVLSIYLKEVGQFYHVFKCIVFVLVILQWLKSRILLEFPEQKIMRGEIFIFLSNSNFFLFFSGQNDVSSQIRKHVLD